MARTRPWKCWRTETGPRHILGPAPSNGGPAYGGTSGLIPRIIEAIRDLKAPVASSGALSFRLMGMCQRAMDCQFPLGGTDSLSIPGVGRYDGECCAGIFTGHADGTAGNYAAKSAALCGRNVVSDLAVPGDSVNWAGRL